MENNVLNSFELLSLLQSVKVDINAELAPPQIALSI